jgi:hypothetical protein
MSAYLVAMLAVLLILVAAVMGPAVIRRVIARGAARVPAGRRRASLTKLYELIVDAGTASGTRPYILYGTLLGHVRNNSLICWDHDVDFGVDNDEYDRLIAALADRLGDRYKLRRLWWPGGRKAQIVDRETGLPADVMPHTTDAAAGTVHRTGVPRWRWLQGKLCCERHPTRHPTRAYYPLRRVQFLTRETYVPADPAALLASYYGADYLTPDRTCECARCRRAAEAVGNAGPAP